MEPKQKWYHTPGGIIALIILFFPVGLYLMWRYAPWRNKTKWIITGIFIFLILIEGASNPSKEKALTSAQSHSISPTTPISQPTVPPTVTPTPEPTAPPIPKDENGFPQDYEKVTIAQIDKVPSAYKNKKIMFTCRVSSFAKNSEGDAAAINCTDPNNYGAFIQVSGPTYDFTKINEDDTVRIYGIGEGVSTGKNAFGADVTEGIVIGIYINDLTSGYKE